MTNDKKKPNPWAGRHEWVFKDWTIFCDGKAVMEVRPGVDEPANFEALGEWIVERLQVEAILNAMLNGGTIS